MATILRAQVNIPRQNLLPADDVINTWHFLTVGSATPSAAATHIWGDLTAFYQAVDANFASYTGTPAILKIYNLADAEPRVPITTQNIALTVGSGNAMPAEVAVCMSYRGDLVSGTNPARRRGRIYLGPFDADPQTLSAGDATVSSTLRTTIATAAKALIVAGTTHDARWVAFSPTLAGPAPWSDAVLVASSVDVFAGFIDNAFDTVRSRGAKATARTLFSVTLP